MYYLVYKNIIFKHHHCTGGLNVNVRYFATLRQLADQKKFPPPNLKFHKGV